MIDSNTLGGFPFQLEEGRVPTPILYMDGITYKFISKKAVTVGGENRQTLALKWKWNLDGKWYGMWYELPKETNKSVINEYKSNLFHYLQHWQIDMKKYATSKPFGRAFIKYSKLRKWMIKLHLV